MINRKISNNKGNRSIRPLLSSSYIFLILTFLLLIPGRADVYGLNAKYIILMISDGWGAKHIEATNNYTGTIPLYQSGPDWTEYWMSTFPYGGSYNPARAWSDFNYVLTGFTDSAAAGTALYSGFKTANGRITVSYDASTAFFSIGERAKDLGKAVGAVSTVPVSDATPGAWVAHNDDRGNTFAIADEGFFGDPNTTGTVATDVKYGGGHGPTMPPADVIIGDGSSGYISSQILNRLRNESGQPGKHVLVERKSGADGGDALMAEANDPATEKLAGLFDHIYHNADDSGYNPENPTLSESALAAIKVLSRNPNGFVLMIEGGAVDKAAHANNMDQMIGEQEDFDHAVQTVINWVDDPANDSDWDNTLVIVTGDHECGYLTKDAGIFPNQPLGAVNSTTLAKEKIVSGTAGRRASWEDADGDNLIDPGETVYWRWNSGNHSNSLIPLYAKGADSELLAGYAEKGPDPVRGYYIDNTDVFLVMADAISDQTCIETGSVSMTPGQTLSGNPINLTSIVTADNAVNLNFTVTESGNCPAQTNASIITKRDTWRYNGASNGNIGTTWKNTAYDDSGWNTGSGVFGYGETYITTPLGAPGQMSAYFRKTFTICDANEVTSLRFNATYDDGISVYINGTQVINAGVSGNPPAWNGGAVNHESNQLYQTFNLDAYTGLLVSGTNVIAVGNYNTDSTSSDLVFDGELVINNNMGGSILFTGNSAQAQSVSTAGWTDGEKNLEVIADDAVCLTPLPYANDTFTFNNGPSCIETGSVSMTPGQTLSGNPIDLTSIVAADNAVNLNFTVTETENCPAQTNASIITKRDTWRYNGASNGNIGTTWKNTAYDDSGWNTGSGVFGYGETYITTPLGAPGQMSAYFRKTFTICDANEVTSLRFNATYDDGISVYINGTQVINAGVSGNPPAWNGGAVNHESNQLYQTFNLDAYTGLLVSGTNVIAVGNYNTDSTSSDLVFDGELVINNNMGVSVLFTGNSIQAQSVNTAGWTDGEKNVEVTGDDAVCLTPLPAENGSFNYSIHTSMAGITVMPTSGLVTTEAGGTAAFTVKLNTQPAANVTIGLSSSDMTEGTVSPASLTFTSANWNTPQTVTVTGVNDDVADGNILYNIITAAASSSDTNYNGINAADVSVTNNDNDDNAGITVTPISGLVTTESGGTATFTIILNSEPASSVTIDLTSSDTSEGIVSPASLTFIPENWNTFRVVTITGVDDYVADGNQAYKIITHATASSDSKYNGIDPNDVSVINMDNDTPGIKIEPSSGLVTDETGGAAGFKVKLNSQPAASVNISLSSSDTTEGTVSPSSLTFTAANWNIDQPVTVKGVDDFEADGNQPYFIVTHPAASSDPVYNGLNPVDVSVVNNDNERPGITVNPTSGLTTNENGGKAIFKIVLNTSPAAPVTIDLSSSDTTEGKVSPLTVTFTPEDWNRAKKITITGVDDSIRDGDQPYTIITHTAVSTDSAYNGLNAADVSVLNNDNEMR
jgi:alkaline phosphatase